MRKWDCNVPTLRFDFDGIWNKIHLYEITNKVSRKAPVNSTAPIRMISYGNGFILQSDKYSRDNAGESLKKYTLLKKGEMAYNHGASKNKKYGVCYSLKESDEARIPFVYHAFQINRGLPAFWNYALNISQIDKQLKKLVSSGARMDGLLNISYDDYMSISVYEPCVDEQAKISAFLSVIDKRIAVQNKIISKYETLIKGIYHDFFSKPADYAIKIKDLIIKGKAGGTPSSTVAQYYNGDIPFLSISDMTKQGKYVSYTEKHISKSGIENSSAWIVPSNSLIFSMYASVGLVCINTVPLATSQAMFSMVLKDHRMIEYIYYYLNFFRETKIHRHIETGTQSNINAETVRNIDIPFQSNHLKLVETLNSIEKRLNNEKDMLSLLLDLKAYLLSKLFI